MSTNKPSVADELQAAAVERRTVHGDMILTVDLDTVLEKVGALEADCKDWDAAYTSKHEYAAELAVKVGALERELADVECLRAAAAQSWAEASNEKLRWKAEWEDARRLIAELEQENRSFREYCGEAPTVTVQRIAKLEQEIARLNKAIEDANWLLSAHVDAGGGAAALVQWAEVIYNDRVAALAADPQGPSDGWLPIESAPKDGTRVLVGWLGVTGNTGRFDRQTNLWFDSVSGKFFLPEHPTHWQPLPAPPASERPAEVTDSGEGE